MFDMEAAKELWEGSKGKPPLSQPPSGESSKQAAREAALAARGASRVLQSLPSKVACTFGTSTKSIAFYLCEQLQKLDSIVLTYRGGDTFCQARCCLQIAFIGFLCL